MARNTRQPSIVASAKDLRIAGEKVDGRSVTARRYRDLFNDLALQLGDHIAPSEAALLRRAAAFSALCEKDEEAIAAGQDFDQENYRRNAQALRSTLIALGMAKKSRDVTKQDMRFLDQHTLAVLGEDQDD